MCYRDLFSQDQVIRKVPNTVIKKKNTQANMKKNPKKISENEKESWKPSRRHPQKTQLLKVHSLQAFQRSNSGIPIWGFQKGTVTLSCLISEDFCELLLMRQSISPWEVRISKPGTPRSRTIIPCQQGCSNSKQSYGRGYVLSIFSSTLFLRVLLIHTHTYTISLYSTAFIMLGLNKIIF